MQTTQCLILAGGYGSRLGHLTKKTPKPLIKINKKPFILYLIKNLYRQGIRDIIILTFYKNSQFLKKSLINFKDIKIKVIKEKKKLGTLGSVVNVKNFLQNRFFVVNGDTYFDFNIRDLEYNLLKRKKDVGVALTKIKSSENKFSYQFYKGSLKKIDFSQKKIKYICGGLYYFKKKILNSYSNQILDIDKDLIKEVFRKKLIFAKYYKNNFLDIGTPKDLRRSSSFLKKNVIKPCAFLDRDGVINEDLGHVHTIKKTIWKKNIFKSVKYLNDNNFRVIILTNQAGIAKGYYTLRKFLDYSEWFCNEFFKNGAFIDQIYFSPFHPDGKIKKYSKKKNCRKPGNGMLIQALNDWEIDKKKSFLIGDKETDLIAGKKSDIKSFLVQKIIFNQVKKLVKI